MQQPMAVEIVAAVILLYSAADPFSHFTAADSAGTARKCNGQAGCGISGSLDHCFHRNRYDRETSPCCGEASGGQHAE